MIAGSASALSQDRMRAVDGHLAAAWADRVSHDARLARLAVRVRFDRGVAQLAGDLASQGEHLLVRDLLGQLAGVHAVWSGARIGGREPVVLDLGCGATKQFAAGIGLDLRPAPGVDALADLSRPLPLSDSCADVVFAVHILEHLTDFMALVDEVHRVLRPAGMLHVISPWWGHVNAVADPTHVRLLDVQTIKGICRTPAGEQRWFPRHVGCDGASVFADLTPLGPGDPLPSAAHLARFFD